MGLHGAWRELEPHRDLFVRQALRDQAEDVDLSFGQLVRIPGNDLRLVAPGGEYGGDGHCAESSRLHFATDHVGSRITPDGSSMGAIFLQSDVHVARRQDACWE